MEPTAALNQLDRLHLETAQKNLNENGFNAEIISSRDQLNQRLEAELENVKTIGFGGSYSISQLNIKEKLTQMDRFELLDHGKPGLSAEERYQIMRRQQLCDLFITSTNALTLSGELVNIDGAGNRVAAMIFGPTKVIVIAGVNKIVADLDSGFERIARIAAPANTLRLEKNTPCRINGYCSDCNSPERICRSYVVLRKRPKPVEYRVFLLTEPCGF